MRSVDLEMAVKRTVGRKRWDRMGPHTIPTYSVPGMLKGVNLDGYAKQYGANSSAVLVATCLLVLTPATLRAQHVTPIESVVTHVNVRANPPADTTRVGALNPTDPPRWSGPPHVPTRARDFNDFGLCARGEGRPQRASLIVAACVSIT